MSSAPLQMTSKAVTASSARSKARRRCRALVSRMTSRFAVSAVLGSAGKRWASQTAALYTQNGPGDVFHFFQHDQIQRTCCLSKE